MKKIIVLLAVVSFGLTACSSDNNGLNPRNHKGTTMNLSSNVEPGNKQNNMTNNDVANGRFGFVRHQQSPDSNKEARDGDVPSIDREQLADSISRLSVRLPNVYDASVLVTNREVLVGYKAHTNNRNMTADQVKNTALSIVPRYFHAYVTDSPQILPDIQRFQNLPPDRDIDNMLNDTIKEIKQSSPQGKNVSDGENPNGEDKGDQTPEKTNNQK